MERIFKNINQILKNNLIINSMKRKLKSAFKKIKGGFFENALEILNDILEKDNENYEAYLYRAKVKRELHDSRGALEDYNSAARIYPDRAEVYNNRSKLFYLMCFYEKALEDIKRADELYPDCPLILFNRGIIESKLHLFREALLSFGLSIKLDPSFVHAYLKRGLLKEKLGDFYGAYGDYTSVIKLNKKCVYAYYYRGRLLLNFIKDEVRGKEDLRIAYNMGLLKSEIQHILENDIPRIKIIENEYVEKAV